MQDQYAGDVGDFGKFGLLRHLLAVGKLASRLGVVWYYFNPHVKTNNDGRHVSFYEDRALCDCDTELATRLRAKVLSDRRLAALESAGILPPATAYVRSDLNFAAAYPGQSNVAKKSRLQARERWLDVALREVSGCDLVFLDPDNGVEAPSCRRKSQTLAGKYAYLDEIRSFKEQAATVVLYHHLGRQGKHEQQVAEGAKSLACALGRDVRVFGLRFWRYSPRAFFVLCSPAREAATRGALGTFMSSWGAHWDTFTSA
jgi:hypothetical protein